MDLPLDPRVPLELTLEQGTTMKVPVRTTIPLRGKCSGVGERLAQDDDEDYPDSQEHTTGRPSKSNINPFGPGGSSIQT